MHYNALVYVNTYIRCFTNAFHNLFYQLKIIIVFLLPHDLLRLKFIILLSVPEL